MKDRDLPHGYRIVPTETAWELQYREPAFLRWTTIYEAQTRRSCELALGRVMEGERP